MDKINLGVVFGGKSVEHEVSIITGLQIIANADKEKYNIIPVYIDKEGKWFTGQALLDINSFKDIPALKKKISEEYLHPGSNSSLIPTSPLSFVKQKIKIDVVFPAIHGTFGEDGTLQGFLEMANVPYVGSGVTGSALGMDKILQKDVFKANSIPVINYSWFLREEWISDRDRVIKKIEGDLDYPMVVKPANLGSSVGIHKVKDREELITAIELAVVFDRRIIVEHFLSGVVEINCSVLGYSSLETSVCEQPVKSEELLSYEDKYLRGNKGDGGDEGDQENRGKNSGMASLSRIIPAPISQKQSKEIAEMAKKVFRVCDCSGVARIDFFLHEKSGKFWVCEINTLPGSISFYLWEKSNYPFPKLIAELVDLAMERFHDRKQTNYSFSSNLLQGMAKGSKGP